MPRSVFHYLLFFLLLLLVCTYFPATAQTASLPLAAWVKKLDAPNDHQNRGFAEIQARLGVKERSLVDPVLKELEKKGATAGTYFWVRFLCLKASLLYRTSYPDKPPAQHLLSVKKLFSEAILRAYETNDDHLITFVSWTYAQFMYAYQEIELAVAYGLKAVELNQGLPDRIPYKEWVFLGELLFHTRDYEKSIYYTRKGIDHWTDLTPPLEFYIIKGWNTIGQAYQTLGRLDSALVCYERSMQLAHKTNYPAWEGINSGFMGQVFFLQEKYARAKQLLAYDYHINRKSDLNIAAYSLHWIARINLKQGWKDSALLQLKEALRLLRVASSFPLQNRNYLRQVYYATADAYRALGNTDSVYHYLELYAALHDSLEKVATLSSTKIAQMRVDNEKSIRAIQVLQQQKKAEKLKRNFTIGAIIMLCIMGLLYLNRRRLRSRYNEQLALQQKAAAEAEVGAAREQLHLFTRNILEKTDLIEKLQWRVAQKERAQEQQQLVDQINLVTILTEEDWTRFKTLFEKIYPGFFIRLKDLSPDMTLAELRMAALTRLHLTPKEMASMLGISLDSVHKTRQRLRHRLHLSPETNLEESIATL